jgi:hypothetical protein
MIHLSRSSAKLFLVACMGVLLAELTINTARAQQEIANTEQALAIWLRCEYCEHGELEAVTRQGETMVPSLAAALTEGLSAKAGEGLRKDLEARYDALVQQSKENPNAPIAVTKEEFVKLYQDNSAAHQRVRAAQALAAIGGQRARAALEAAVANQAYRDDVREMLRDLLNKHSP